MSEFIKGAKYAFSGFGLITKPGIRLYVLIPLLINTLLFTIVIIYGAHLLGDLMDWLSAQWAWLEWITWLLWPVFVIIILLVVFFCFSIVANLIGAPFNGFLAAAVEAKLTARPQTETVGITNFFHEIWMGLKGEFRKFLYFLCRALPLLLLFIIPLVQAVAPIIWLLFAAWMMALEYMDYPMGNHSLFFPDIRQRVRAKRTLSMGFGSGVLLLTMIPILNFIAMPVAVAGATKLYLDEFNTYKT